MSKIEFDKENHHYYLVDENGKSTNDLVSVTTLLKKHNLAPDYSTVDRETLKAKAQRGTIIHEELQNYIEKGEIGFTSELQQFIYKANENLIKPLKSEYIVHNDEIAGTVDVSGFMGEDKISFIGDFKTTVTLHKKAVAWQLSLYAYLEDAVYEKYLAIHFPNEDTCKIVEIQPIPREEIEKLLECERNSELYQERTLELDSVSCEKIMTIQQELKTLDDRKKELEQTECELKKMLIEKMEETGVKSIDNDYFKITYIAPSTRETLDSAKLKKELPEIASQYVKTSTIKASVRISLKD